MVLLRTIAEGKIFLSASHKQWLIRKKSALVISNWGLEAYGHLGGSHRGQLLLPWKRITDLHFATKAHGLAEGLYASEGEWCSRCVLPWMSEQQTESVINMIEDYRQSLTTRETDPVSPQTSMMFTESSKVWWRVWGRRDTAIVATATAAHL